MRVQSSTAPSNGSIFAEQEKVDSGAKRPNCPTTNASPRPAITRLRELPPEIWGGIFRHVDLPQSLRRNIGDLKALRLTCKMFRAETYYAQPELFDHIASGAARAFLHAPRNELDDVERSTLRQARVLNLRHVRMGSEMTARLNLLFAQLPHLVGLDLSDNAFGDRGDHGTRSLELDRLKSLQSLNMSGNRLRSNDARDLNLKQLQSLQTLDLSSNWMDASSARELGLGQLSNLHTLDLGSNELGDGGVRDLAIAGLKNLRKLDLSCNRIGDAGARDLAIGQLQNLQTLILYNNRIGEAGARDLAIGALQNLQTLDLWLNRIGNAGARDLAIGQLKNLRLLQLDENHIGDEGVRNLAIGQHSNLETLGLINNSVGTSALLELRKRIPQTKVEH